MYTHFVVVLLIGLLNASLIKPILQIQIFQKSFPCSIEYFVVLKIKIYTIKKMQGRLNSTKHNQNSVSKFWLHIWVVLFYVIFLVIMQFQVKEKLCTSWLKLNEHNGKIACCYITSNITIWITHTNKAFEACCFWQILVPEFETLFEYYIICTNRKIVE